MRMKRAKKGWRRNACLAMASVVEAAAVKLVEQQEVAMEMKRGEDAAWERSSYEDDYLVWWKRWDWEERVAPTLGRECPDGGFDPANPLDVLVYGLPEY